MTSRKTVTSALTQASMSYWLHKGFSSHAELCVDVRRGIRADVVSMNLRGRIIISEVKSSVADYKTDRKWQSYLDYCNAFYFVFTLPVWEKLAPTERQTLRAAGAGAFILCPKTGYLRNVVPATQRKLAGKIRRILLTRLAWRGGYSKKDHRRTRIFINDQT